ncbi:MAG: hypothetical protein PSV16_00725 [Flavobacterium sp.]|nr:hypothetical protein [Flavobacterium sp.]
MKSLIIICFLIAGVISVQAQEEPSVAALMRFEDNPVGLYTGIPDVSIPFASLPTRSKSIGMNIGLSYHASSVSAYSQAGDCGLGWSMSSGGTIVKRLVDETFGEAHGYYYEFNFMGHMGRFSVVKTATNLSVTDFRTNSGEVLKILVNFTTLSNIIGFTVYDDKGYKYLFDSYDTTDVTLEDNSIETRKGAYHLGSISDNNGKQLMSFKYRNFIPDETTDKYKKIDSIYSNGFGKFVFNYSTGTSNVYTENLRISSVELKDLSGAQIKTLNLDIGGVFKNLNKVEVSYPNTTQKDTYVLKYKPSGISGATESVDMWGYKNTIDDCYYNNWYVFAPSPDYCTVGVLEQMVLPSGGSIIYDYESNTYNNYYLGTDNKYHLDETLSQFYSSLPAEIPEGAIEGNDIRTIFNADSNSVPYVDTYTTGGSSAVHQFTITATKTYFFTTDAYTYTVPGIEDENGNPNLKASFTIYGPAPALTEGTVNHSLNSVDNNLNRCLGRGILLTPGTYTITCSGIGPANIIRGKVVIQTIENNPNPTTFFYGGGIRIKRIGYFDKSDVPQNYYVDMTQYNLDGIYPAKEKNYSYNLFDKPGFSSGVAVDIYYSPEELRQRMSDQIGYRNITVTDTPNNGKTEYTYSTYIDYIDIVQGVSVEDDHRRGLLLSEKIYNTNNELLSSNDFTYGSYDYAIVHDTNHPHYSITYGWSGLTQKISKRYFPGVTDPLTTIETNTYNPTNRQLASTAVVNGLGETYTTTYDYDTGNSIYSQNRLADPKEVKSYKGTSLLSTAKINYSNTLANNNSYLPVTVTSAKGSNTPTTITHTNAYDQYSNVLETQPENGIKTSYVWGYNRTQPVAKIENMAYSDIPTALITDIEVASGSAGSEALLLTKLDALRNNSALAGARVTTYTYKPLIGMSTVTDMNGQRMTYSYDEQNRLQYVYDAQGNLLKENKYNNKTQN